MQVNLQIENHSGHLSKRERNNSILFACFISETLICSMAGQFLSIPNLSVIVSALLLFCVFINNGKISGRIVPLLLTAGTIIFLLMVSLLLNGTGSIVNYLANFLCFGMTSIILVSTNYNIGHVCKVLIKIYVFYLIFYLLFIRSVFLNGSTYWSEQMGRAYGFVPIIVFAFAMLLYRDIFHTTKSGKIVIFLMGALALVFLAFDCGTRGALVSVVISFVFLLIAKEKRVKRLALILMFGVAAVCVVNYYREILQFAHSFLNAHGINIGALDKMVFLLNTDGADNGRNVLYESAKQYFYASPIIGNGVGYYEKMQDSYAHNIVLEILCEFGILGLFVLVWFIAADLRILMKGKITQTKAMGLFFFCISIPMLLFSNSYWLLPQFWIYVFWTIINYRELRKKITI